VGKFQVEIYNSQVILQQLDSTLFMLTEIHLFFWFAADFTTLCGYVLVYEHFM
jgi:hypothetical protein